MRDWHHGFDNSEQAGIIWLKKFDRNRWLLTLTNFMRRFKGTLVVSLYRDSRGPTVRKSVSKATSQAIEIVQHQQSAGFFAQHR